MKIRFGIDQEECFRKGNNYSQTTATLDIDPQELSEEQRELIAPRLRGNSVVKLQFGGSGPIQDANLILSAGPALDDLLEACKNNQAEIQAIYPLTASRAGKSGRHAPLS